MIRWKTNLLVLTLILVAYLSHSQTASYYADKFHGRRTASGEVFSQNALTCASNHYPIGTKLVLASKKDSNKKVTVTVNDRGQLYGRSLDLSKAAFRKLADLRSGVIHITIKQL